MAHFRVADKQGTPSYNPHPDGDDYPVLSSFTQCCRLALASRLTKPDCDRIVHPTDYGKDWPRSYRNVRTCPWCRWIRPEKPDQVDQFGVIEAAEDPEWPIDVLIPFNLIKVSSGDCYLRIRLRRVQSPCSKWSSLARNSDYSSTADCGCRGCRRHVSL